MYINFENYGRFYVSLAYADNSIVDYRVASHTLKQCMNFIEYCINTDSRIVLGILCDWDTGEIVATIENN